MLCSQCACHYMLRIRYCGAAVQRFKICGFNLDPVDPRSPTCCMDTMGDAPLSIMAIMATGTAEVVGLHFSSQGLMLDIVGIDDSDMS